MIRPALACLLLLPLAAAEASGFEIDSREYKLMLEPGKFGNPADSDVGRLWTEALKPLIDRELGLKNGKPRSKKSFDTVEERRIRFRDAKIGDARPCVLDGEGYALRERTTVAGNAAAASREVTLKFRTPDLFQAAAADETASKQDTDTKLEEDIAPLIVRTKSGGGQETIVAQPQSMRSLFSVSTKLAGAEAGAPFKLLGDVSSAFPTWSSNLKHAGIAALPGSTGLMAGPEIRERVFEGAKVDLDLDDDKEAKFAVTLWYGPGDAGPSTLLTAEVSFKYKVKDAEEATARLAQRLFQAMQGGLGDWPNPKLATKTSLALPGACH